MLNFAKYISWAIPRIIPPLILINAIGFMTARSDLEIEARIVSEQYVVEKTLRFYRDRKLKYPYKLLKELSPDTKSEVKRLVKAAESPDIYAGHTTGAMVSQVVGGATAEPLLKDNYIPKLLRQLESPALMPRRIYSFSSSGYVFGRGDAFKMIESAKQNLSESELFIFLSALLSAREFDSEIEISNTGKLDLKNVKISVPYPPTAIDEIRSKENLVNKLVMAQLPQRFILEDTQMVLAFPKLARGEHLIARVRTRENAINGSEIVSDYITEKALSIPTLIWSSVISLLVSIVIFSIGPPPETL